MQLPASPLGPAPPSHPVTDHAVLRYLERVVGIDIVTIRDHIALTIARGLIAEAPKIKVGNAVFHIRNGRVTTVTVVPKKFRRKPRYLED